MTETSRNVDELKRLVLSQLDSSGVLSELRSTVKLHVMRTIKDELAEGSVTHPRNPRIQALMESERGQLLGELVLEFLRFYDLRDTMAMLQVEAGLGRLRPSETELASQCGLPVPNNELSILEQCLARHAEDLNYPPHHEIMRTDFDAVQEDTSPLPVMRPQAVAQDSPVFRSDPGDLSPPLPARDVISALSPMDNEVEKMRNISQEMERISLSSLAGQRYEDDGFDSEEETPRPRKFLTVKKKTDEVDAVLFESRDSPLRDLGEAPASAFPIDRNDFVEKVI
jgi:hypothetical protein